MFIAKVTGSLVSTQKVESMVGYKLLIVEPYRLEEKRRQSLATTGRTFVAVDMLGAGNGDFVLITQGSSARMTPETVMSLGQQALTLTVMIAAPMLLSALAVGLFVGMIQAATQINEMTLSFIPKLLVLALAIAVGGSWMMRTMLSFTRQLYHSIPSLIG